MERSKSGDHPSEPAESNSNLDDGESFQVEDLPTQSGRIDTFQPHQDATKPSHFGRYEIKKRIGAGGMGEVYLAYDTVLKRLVALKLLYGNNPVLVRRFLQEARTQAKVEHESICRVYEASEENGRNFIAMQFINGRTFTNVLAEMNLDQKLLVIRQVADALHAAHVIGLVHRDVKPANIMVEKKEEEVWKPYVLDFGLARENDEPRMTLSGVVMGTPYYMAPEQATEGTPQLDGRTDVYSLGATLYEALSGKTVFEGSTAIEILKKVANDNPVPLHVLNPSIPFEVETIVMKCLEKEPDRRYQTAEALSEDLRRYMNHEPIHARPSTWSYRLSKKAKKHKSIVAIVSIAVLVTVALSGLLFWTQWKARRQAHYAAKFGNEARFIETTVHSIFSAPLHNVRPPLEQLRARIVRMEKEIQNEGALAHGPGYDALGIGYLALRDYGKAKECLDKAWKSGYREPSTAFALGKVYGFHYQKALIQASRLPGKTLQDRAKKEAETLYAKTATTYLNLAQGHVESPNYVEGLIALYNKRYSEALEKAALASVQVSWPYEAKKLQGDVQMALAAEQVQQENFGGAVHSIRQAGKSYAEAIEFARSSEEAYLAYADHWLALLKIQTHAGGSVDTYFKDALQSCERALITDPDGGGGYLCKSNAYFEYGRYQQDRASSSASETLLNSARMAEIAASKRPNVEAISKAGTAYFRIAEHQLATGIDPQPALKNSITSSERALQLDPQYNEAYYNLAAAYFFQGDYELNHGQNPMASLQKVIEIFNSKLEGGAPTEYDRNNIGLAHLDIGIYHLWRGEDPRPHLQKAIEQYRKALEVNPKAVAVSMNLGLAYFFLAAYEIEHGLDPTPNLKEAYRAYDLPTANQDSPHAHTNKASVLLLEAEYKILLKQNPDINLKNAWEQTELALKNNPQLPYALVNSGYAYVLRGQYELMMKKDAMSSIQEARKILKQAIGLDPTFSESHSLLAETELLQVRQFILQNKSPATYLVAAKESAGKAIELNPLQSVGFRIRAEVDCWESDWLIRNNKPAANTIASGLQWIEKGKKQNPKDAEMIALEGVFHLLTSKQAINNEKAQEDVEKALNCFQRAFQLNPLIQQHYEPQYLEALNSKATNPIES